MRLSDRIIQKSTLFLTDLLLNPKVFFQDQEQKECRLDEPSILVINHTSHLDGPILCAAFRHDTIHSLAAKDRFEQKGFGFFLRHTGCIPIDRQKPDLTWVHDSLDTLHKKKESIAIFPEGRHGTHRHQLPFHSGVVMLAAVAQVPVVMVYIDGPFKLGRRDSRLIVSRPFRLNAPTNGMNTDYINEQTALLQDKMTSLMNDFIRMDDKR